MAVQKDRGGSIRVSTGAVIAVLAILVMAPGCTKDADTATTARSVADLPPDVQRADFAVRGSLEQVSVEDATPGEELALHDRSGASVAVGTADEQGSLLFRLVEPGKGYRVATTTLAVTASDPIDVRSVDGSVPEQSFYDDQDLAAGFTYITTRDGTTLSASVYLPGPVGARLRLPLRQPYACRNFDPVAGEYVPGSSTASEPVVELPSPLPHDAVVVLTAVRDEAQ